MGRVLRLVAGVMRQLRVARLEVRERLAHKREDERPIRRSQRGVVQPPQIRADGLVAAL